MKNIFILLLFPIFLAACSDDSKLPDGFEHISKDGRSHFVYVHEEYLGDKLAQRMAGRIICKNMFKEEDYCEVYYFDSKEKIPTQFPIMNRIRPVGTFEIKNGKEIFKVLSESK
jgi:hypothetical protein